MPSWYKIFLYAIIGKFIGLMLKMEIIFLRMMLEIFLVLSCCEPGLAVLTVIVKIVLIVKIYSRLLWGLMSTLPI